jgi:prepilin-type N-terminal cleavage/methylation domain-containing protein
MDLQTPMKTNTASVVRSSNGFSLIEIAIVVAVIGVAAMVALPNLFSSRSTAEETVCITNLKAIMTAKEAWGFEHNKALEDTPLYEDIKPFLSKNQTESICPLGGKYTIGALNENPTCEFAAQGHKLPDEKE